MRKFLLVCAAAVALAAFAPEGRGQSETPKPAAGARQDRLIGEVTAIDAAGQITIKTDAGQTVSLKVDEQTSYLRIAPGETTLERATKITRADVSIGDRVLVRGVAATNGTSLPVRQVFVMSREAAAGQQERDREEGRRRALSGRITALNPERKEITVLARSREGAEPVVIAVAGSVRILRYAPDSLRATDARPSSFGELKINDQLRARGDRSSDGTRFTPEEIIAGAVTRISGTVTAINAERGEVTLKNEQTGKTQSIVVGKNSMLRRIPPDVAETFAQRREGRRARNDGRTEQSSGERRDGRRERPNAGEGESGARERQRGGRNLQQTLENLPPITVADLKKGDVVLVTGTAEADASRLTAISLVTGEAEFMKRLQRLQGQPDGGSRNANPGLPGDVLGGGTGNRDQP